MLVVKHDLKYKIVYESNNLKELQHKLEELSYEYVCQYEKIPFEFNEKYGYYMVHKPNKIQIFKKTKNRGWAYDSDVIQKIISFLLIEPKRTKRLVEQVNIEMLIEAYQDVYLNKKEVIEELKMNVDGVDIEMKTNLDFFEKN